MRIIAPATFSGYYYQPRSVDDAELALLRQMDVQYLKTPQYGSRSYATWFQRQGIEVGREKAVSMMKTLGIVILFAHKILAHTWYNYIFLLYK